MNPLTTNLLCFQVLQGVCDSLTTLMEAFTKVDYDLMEMFGPMLHTPANSTPPQPPAGLVL